MARNIPQAEHTILDREACKVQGMPLEVQQAPEIKSRTNKPNPIPKLIGSQQVRSIDQIFLP